MKIPMQLISLTKIWNQNSWLRRLSLFTFSTVASLNISFSVVAAETIRFVTSAVRLDIKVSELQTYAEEGKLSRQLRSYFNIAGASEEDKAAFRKALTTKVEIDPLLLSRVLNTEEGERLLEYFGQVINVQGGRNGKFLLRGALVTSALEEEGLTLINVLNNLATNVEINISQAIVMARLIDTVVQASYLFAEEIGNLAEAEAEQDEPINFSELPDLRQPGQYQVVKQRWNLTDSSRNRPFYVDVYQPQQGRAEQNSVIVISHGLSSSPEDFSKRAEHLASYGYVVALPQHRGSDVKQTEDFLEGNSRQIFQRNEFIDRPLDISYTLDELERRNKSEFGGKLDLDNVGVFGHSFGGYTVLAVAGATPNFERLERVCAIELGKLNTALLLQCRALKLERKNYNFRDERVKAVYTINPVAFGVFGPQELQNIEIPAFMAAGSFDPATPFVFEQTSTYPNLTKSPSTYLQLQQGQAHVDFSELDAGITDLLGEVGNLTLPSPTLLDDYTNSLMLAFFKVHISQDKDYQPFLQSSYAIYLSEGEDFKTNLITKDSSAELNQFIEKFTDERRIERVD